MHLKCCLQNGGISFRSQLGKLLLCSPVSNYHIICLPGLLHMVTDLGYAYPSDGCAKIKICFLEISYKLSDKRKKLLSVDFDTLKYVFQHFHPYAPNNWNICPSSRVVAEKLDPVFYTSASCGPFY